MPAHRLPESFMSDSSLPPESESGPQPPLKPLRYALAGMVVIATVAAAGAWWFFGQSTRTGKLPGRFDLDTAMSLAGEQVPGHIESFYFVVLERGTPDEVTELSILMVKAAGEHDFLGVAGADPEYNLEILAASLARLPPASLSGLVLIYVGPPNQEAVVAPMVQPSGAELRFAPYDPSVPDPADTI
jgi:hypothetical protein